MEYREVVLYEEQQGSAQGDPNWFLLFLCYNNTDDLTYRVLHTSQVGELGMKYLGHRQERVDQVD